MLPDGLRARIVAEALAAFPNECCGLIEGEHASEIVRVHALHATANVNADPASGFEIDPAAHLRLLRSLRGSGHTIVGCYHSHPNGRPGPSERDRENGCEDVFIWLIAALDGAAGAVALAAFEGPSFRPVALAEAPPCA